MNDDKLTGSSLRKKALYSLILASGVATLLPASAYGQSGDSSADFARRYDATSPTGVSYSTGAFTYSIPLVSIGDGSAPQALSFSLNYNSGSNRSPAVAWSSGFSVRMSRTMVDDPNSTHPDPDGKPHPEWQTWRYNVVVGNNSTAFENYNKSPGTNSYDPISVTTATLAYTNSGGVDYTYITENGDIVTFAEITAGKEWLAGDWLAPDGTKLTFGIRRFSTNRGMGIIMEPSVLVGAEYETKICAVNFAKIYDNNLTTCPAGVQTAIVRGSGGSLKGFTKVSSITLPDGSTYNFDNEPNRAGSNMYRVKCVKLPGESTCSVTNTYDACDGAGTEPSLVNPITGYDPSWNGSRDRVIQQVFATGETITYSYLPAVTSANPCRENSRVTETIAPGEVRYIYAGGDSGVVSKITDQLGNDWTATYTGDNVNGPSVFLPEATDPKFVTSPEGNTVEHIYDEYGRETETKVWTRDGSSSISTYATYPTGCPNPVTCNKPVTTIDARGNTTSYSYASTHGGVVLVTPPAVGGVSPKVRTSYAQRYAWVKNSSGTYSQAPTPVDVVNWTKTCRTTNWVDDTTGCAGGVSDQVMTQYLYGPNNSTQGDNLWPRGVAVTADGETLVTCFGYDDYGRKISETKPEAGLTTCP